MIEMLITSVALCSCLGVVVGMILMFSGYVTEGGVMGGIGIALLFVLMIFSENEISKNPELLAVREFCYSQHFSHSSLAKLSESKYVLCSSNGGLFSSGRSSYYTSDEFSNWRELNE